MRMMIIVEATDLFQLSEILRFLRNIKPPFDEDDDEDDGDDADSDRDDLLILARDECVGC